jgi:hypothetical protein
MPNLRVEMCPRRDLDPQVNEADTQARDKKMNLLTEEMRYKLFHLWMGAALGSSLAFFSGGCAASGQCPTCGACVARLPILALPVLADGAVMLVGHVQRAVEEKRKSSS